MAKEDISKRAILVLLVLTIVVSVVGTVTVLEKASDSAQVIGVRNLQRGKVKLDIRDLPSSNVQPDLTNNHITGEVSLDIRQKEV
ncbi:hypothetical protein HOK51_06165 [Candidatus Woesearchaeota archaeon]|jgi:hypothetical protein|nr:hypothetical protein [Candidatus Woesearchaeota archaeon]MBT6519410.1 hypothetical protein [Candidatus Woesearchaeota archaeon]MBT7368082.1 hypothetical protein [Candidatus Woesearchaeota archaeon]